MSTRRAFPFRCRWTTWVVGGLGVGLAVLVNWPLPYCELRVGTPDAEVDGTSGGSGYVTTVHGSRYAGVPWRFYERVSDTWLLGRWHAPGPETRWYPRRLVGNILLAVLLIVFAMSYWQMRWRRARRLLQITLSDIVIAMLAIGMGFGGWRILQDRQQRQSRLYHAEDVLGHETTVRLPECVSDWLDSKHVTCLTTCTWLSVKEPTSDRLRELGMLHDLELLKIRGGSYGGEDLAVLSRLPRLRMLGLSGTPAARGFLDQRSTLANLHAPPPARGPADRPGPGTAETAAGSNPVAAGGYRDHRRGVPAPCGASWSETTAGPFEPFGRERNPNAVRSPAAGVLSVLGATALRVRGQIFRAARFRWSS